MSSQNFGNGQIKEVWADIKFIPADPNRRPQQCTTKKPKYKRVISKLKEIWRIIRNK